MRPKRTVRSCCRHGDAGSAITHERWARGHENGDEEERSQDAIHLQSFRVCWSARAGAVRLVFTCPGTALGSCQSLVGTPNCPGKGLCAALRSVAHRRSPRDVPSAYCTHGHPTPSNLFHFSGVAGFV